MFRRTGSEEAELPAISKAEMRVGSGAGAEPIASRASRSTTRPEIRPASTSIAPLGAWMRVVPVGFSIAPVTMTSASESTSIAPAGWPRNVIGIGRCALIVCWLVIVYVSTWVTTEMYVVVTQMPKTRCLQRELSFCVRLTGPGMTSWRYVYSSSAPYGPAGTRTTPGSGGSR